MARIAAHPNMLAFLDALAFAEGTAARGDDGYNVMVGGELFTSYNDHPRRSVWLRRYGIHSTAAGRYQFLVRTWDDLVSRLNLPDFSPVSQDRGAIALVRQCRAVDLVEAGRFADAVQACRKIWASLPGAGYGQRELKLDRLADAYAAAGGALA